MLILFGLMAGILIGLFIAGVDDYIQTNKRSK